MSSVLGDRSFDALFHRAPTSDDEEVLRIKTHLSFVEQQLRARDTSHLSQAQRHARVVMLDRLNAYWMNGVFPRNPEGSTARVPRFVEPADATNLSPRRVCAVGALAEPDLGVDAINAIGASHEHAIIGQIHDRAFLDWAAASGLDTNELAMIQPSYNHMPRPIEDDGELSDAQISSMLATREGGVNQCVHNAISPRQEHPEQIRTNLVITAEGNVENVFVSGTSNETIKSCVESVVSGVHFRQSTTPKRAAHSFRIVGPRRADGSLELAYLPSALRRADAAVNRCSATLVDQQQLPTHLVVVVNVTPAGFFQVKSISTQSPFATSPQTRSCITRAIELLPAPTFQGPALETSHAYVMSRSKKVMFK